MPGRRDGNPSFVGHRLCERQGISWLHDFEYTNVNYSGALHPNVEGDVGYAGAAQAGKDM